MQIDRLFDIVYTLLRKKSSTAAELAERFGISKRTILRDIETLSVAGIPILTSPGKGGGVSISSSFVLDKASLSEEERNQLVIGLQSLSSTKYINQAAILSKLGILFTDRQWIEVDFSRWGNSEQDKEKFELLKRAVVGESALSFVYAGSAGRTEERTVCPLKLIFKSGSWYLQAYCLSRKDYRIFKIRRMINLCILSEKFDARKFSPPSVEQETPSPASVELRLRFSASAAYRVYDEFSPENISKNRDGSHTVSICLPEDNWLYGYLLSYGAEVYVESPVSVRNRLLEQVEKIKQIYKK